ncbi:MAG TPA: hypothetical protein VHU90_07745 [Galbitalea sp.]|nr:hypothetical protein [Galbitalea sp.]
MSGPVRDSYRYSLSLTEGWYPITPTGGQDAPDIDGLVSTLSLADGQEAGFRAAVDAVWRFACVGMVDGSERWVLVRDKRSGRIDAVLSLDLHASHGVSGPDAYSELAKAETGGDGAIEVINRTIDRHELSVGTAIAIHDFALPRPDPEPSGPATERAVLGLFLNTEPMMVEFSLITQDLGLTDSITEYLLRIVGTFEIEKTQ